MKQIKTLVVTTLLVIAASVFSTASAQKAPAVFKVQNNSNWTIDYMYFSPTLDSYWGDDQLGSYVLGKGAEFSVSLKEGCGDYDIKLVDEDGEECIVQNISLCGGTWIIVEDDLLDCMGY